MDLPAMIQTPLNNLAVSHVLAVKPGLLPGRRTGWRATSHGPDREWSVPLTVSLPVTMVVSLGLWAGLVFAVRALF